MCGIFYTGMAFSKHICKKVKHLWKHYYVFTKYFHIVFFVSKTHGWHFQSFSILMSFQLFILFILLFTPLVVTFFLQRQTSSGFHPFFGLHLFCSWVVFLSHSGWKELNLLSMFPDLTILCTCWSLVWRRYSIAKNDWCDSKWSLGRCFPLSFLPANVVPQILQWREKIRSMTLPPLHPSLKVDGGDLPMGPSSPHSLMI